MAKNTRTFRVFISSTFNDLKAERNALQRYVYPRLRELCRQYGCRFHAIDLRWGVREEAALDQKTMKICLEEIVRCQKITPRPNFIILLGDRYGWCPLPYEIPIEEFKQIIGNISNIDDRVLLTSWYRRDDNAVPPVYDLQPRTGKFTDPINWKSTENRLRSILFKAIERLRLKDDKHLKYVASATEQEIVQGALGVNDASEHVFCFIRSIEIPQKDGSILPIHNASLDYSFHDFIDLDENGNLDKLAYMRLNDLKDRLAFKFQDNIYRYAAQWVDKDITLGHIGSLPDNLEDCLKVNEDSEDKSNLCIDVWRRLSTLVLSEIAQLEEEDPLEKEIVHHHDCYKDRIKFFTGQHTFLKTIVDYIKGKNYQPLAILGASGVGKTTLIGKVIDQLYKENFRVEIIFRFIGATPSSLDVRALLESICRQIARRYKEDESTVPKNYDELIKEFPRKLALVTEEKPLVVFLDALDQLSDMDQTQKLVWLPVTLPPHVRLIVTCLLTNELSLYLNRILPATNCIELEQMSINDGMKLFDRWLTDAKRTLQDHQRDLIHTKLSICRLPLYLKLVFEEVVKWKSYTEKAEIKADIPGIIGDFLTRLSADTNYGELFLSRCLGYLAAAKEGLSENELLDVLSLDEKVVQYFIHRSHYEPPEKRIPVVAWSRLYFDLAPFLSERLADGTRLITFYHRQLSDVISAKYLIGDTKKEQHRNLADYFARQKLVYTTASKKMPNIRALTEMPYNQTHGELWGNLYATLTKFSFLECKSTLGPRTWKDMKGTIKTIYTGVFMLLIDFRLALEKWPIYENQLSKMAHIDNCLVLEQQKEILQAFVRALRRETNVLAIRPELMWQQVYNRLQWSEEPVQKALTPELKRRTSPDAEAWIRRRMPLKESEGLVCTLIGHTEGIRRCKFSHDGTYIVSIGKDSTIRVWDMSTGLERMVIIGDTRYASNGVISPDSSFIVSSCTDGAIKIWDAETGQERKTLTGHNGSTHCCAVSPDGSIIVTGSEDTELKVCNIQTGYVIATLSGHTKSINDCSFSPDGSFVFSCGDDTLRVWDTSTWKEIITLGYKEVRCCAISSDSSFVVAAGPPDSNIIMWDTTTWQEHALSDFSFYSPKAAFYEYLPFAISPDGTFLVSLPHGTSLDLIIWDFAARKNRFTLKGHNLAVRAYAVSPDSSFIVSVSADRTVKVWDSATGEERGTFVGHSAGITDCSISPDGRFIVSASDDGILNVWDIRKVEKSTVHIHHYWSVNACAVSPSGDYFVSAGDDASFKIWDAKTGQKRDLLSGHTTGITDYAVSSDESFIVSASTDRTLRVWDVTSRRLHAVLIGHRESVTSCGISPDNTLIVSGCKDGALKIWDSHTGQEIFNLAGHNLPIRQCIFSPDGSYIVSISDECILKIWDLSSGKERATLTGHNERVCSCQLSFDGSFIVSTSYDNVLKVWDVSMGKEIWTVTIKGKSLHNKIYALSPDGAYIIWADNNHSVKVYDSHSGLEYFTLAGHTGSINELKISNDGTLIVSASDDGTLKVWDLATGRERITFVGHQAPVIACAISPDASFVVSASDSDKENDTLKVWDTNTGKERITLGEQVTSFSTAIILKSSFSQRIESCAVSSDKNLIIAFKSKAPWGTNELIVWDSATGKIRATLTYNTLASTSRYFGIPIISSCSSYIVLYQEKENYQFRAFPHLKIWDASTGQTHAFIISRHLDKINDCAISPCGDFIASVDDEGSLMVWNPATGQGHHIRRAHHWPVNAVAISLDGSSIVTAGSDQTLLIRDSTTLQLRAKCMGHRNAVGTCAISPDGAFIVSGSGGAGGANMEPDMSVRLWDTTTGKELANYTHYLGERTNSDKQLYSELYDERCNERITKCVISPDGAFIISAGSDKTLKIWDVRRNRVRAKLSKHTGGISDCAISPDGKFIVSASLDNNLKVWDLKKGEEKFTLSGHTDVVRACAISPDGGLIVSVSADRSLKVWDARTGQEILSIPLLAKGTCVAFHPQEPRVVCGDQNGGVYLNDLIGIKYNPIIVTPVDTGHGMGIKCALCKQWLPLKGYHLGTVMACLHRGCGMLMRINPFIVGQSRKPWWRFWSLK